MKQVMDTSWGQITDEIQHDGISIGQRILSDIIQVAHEVENTDKFVNRDFFLELFINKDRITHQIVFPSRIQPRISLPTPLYDQSLFKFKRATNEIKLIWAIPSQGKYWEFIKNAKEYLALPEFAEQVQWCILMESGQLEKLVIEENIKLGFVENHGPSLILKPRAEENKIITSH